MMVEKFVCPNCGKEHEKKTYETQAEAVAFTFTEDYFQLIWDMKKDNAKEMPLEEFCKELVLTAVYNYYKNRRRIRIEKGSIQPINGTEHQRD